MATTRTEKPKSSKRDLVIRVVVFGALAVLLVLALLDFQAKQAATATAKGWRDALRANSEESELEKSAFSRLPVQGKPKVESGPAGPNSTASATMDTYTWSGIFRQYVVKVYFGLGADPSVDIVSGPGDDEEQ